MREKYGIDVDDSRVSKITNKLLPMIREWQEQPLQSVYAMVIMDAVHYKVQENGIVVKKRHMWLCTPIWCEKLASKPNRTGYYV